MSGKVFFKIQGSQPEPYSVNFEFSNGRLSASCTCMGAIFGPCKHRLSILTGTKVVLAEGKMEEVEKVRSWVSSSNLKPIIDDLAAAEKRLKGVQKEIKTLKEKMGQALRGSD